MTRHVNYVRNFTMPKFELNQTISNRKQNQFPQNLNLILLQHQYNALESANRVIKADGTIIRNIPVFDFLTYEKMVQRNSQIILIQFEHVNKLIDPATVLIRNIVRRVQYHKRVEIILCYLKYTSELHNDRKFIFLS
ncbi:hypothetical protein BpHYR1_021218 [Brachionus plicatilis]|uniref:Uncharacterized protein n=1 Tax=Brachionus plicatilis TaxID=10195 RepID=A0A3M7T2L4_BRAPC|nr:hypothetical protein BpHYR1_021218 [Brachionus plicatilis]